MSETRIAVCSWSLRPRDPGALADRLRGLGIPRVQLALGPVVREPEVWGDAVVILRAAGIEIVSGMMAMEGEDYSTLDSIARTGGVRPDAAWPRNREHAEAVAGAAADAGIGLVTFHAGFLPEAPWDPARAAMLARLAEIARIFASQGVEAALETGQESAATLLEVLRALDGRVGVNFDPANMILYGRGDPIEALRELAGGARVVQVHVKDALPSAKPGAWGRETPAGEGAVDWPAFFEVALALDPPVRFVIEREGGAAARDDADIRRARDLIAGFLG